MNDDLALYLARQARSLGLDALTLEEADPETLRAFAGAVLTELAALGLVPGEAEVGCWAAPRPAGH
ncbi:hypothetical protein E5F05_07475 [Deinococcus metallilatus]|uniref:Uncharacterized protein n=1 Tax=Deinococcus metallilatus TaxID=1211322 RepID=A0AAJ5JYU4_9DEIO|nr:hypothetical protein [Deinococcus metallilatus]MBB5297118.1 hypothetical protein [Deinococcus metallilatus]QBY07808.1 hypothetical protein E5F05_07475 [Deinococcus metallilatus]RXJ13508.1 hypothetical protein ERJ73_06310 [Deinococcus metallilatus]TLK22335.1 hypothetical protein FCS05_17690 [Deinococcus metallilatus]GMA17371.1 hypothetical protein GCM10025871_37020 [Deinococcus metallilatus]